MDLLRKWCLFAGNGYAGQIREQKSPQGIQIISIHRRRLLICMHILISVQNNYNDDDDAAAAMMMGSCCVIGNGFCIMYAI